MLAIHYSIDFEAWLNSELNKKYAVRRNFAGKTQPASQLYVQNRLLELLRVF